MSEQENRDYYRGRQRQEVAAAGAATDSAARHIHEELAACYAARAGTHQPVEDEPRQQAVAA